MTSLEKFMSLGNVEDDDHVYTPYLSSDDGIWYVEWLLVNEVAGFTELLYDFYDENIDQAIDKAYNWYNNYYLKGKGMEGYMKKVVSL